MMLTMMQKKIVFCIIGRPVFSGLFFFSLANYDAFLGGARTGTQQSNSRALMDQNVHLCIVSFARNALFCNTFCNFP